jgi:hypothetical protein
MSAMELPKLDLRSSVDMKLWLRPYGRANRHLIRVHILDIDIYDHFNIIFSAILIGVFKEGNKKYGLRYAPIIAVLSLGLFFIAKQVIGSMF